jgi:hypothetical protein
VNETETVIELPAKIKVEVLELYDEDTEDFPEEIYERQQEVKAIKEAQDNEVRRSTSEIARQTFKGIAGSAGALGVASARNNTANGNANETVTTTVQKKGLSLIVTTSKNDTDESSGVDIQGGASVKIPSMSSILGNNRVDSKVQTKMLLADDNPFVSSSTDSSGSSDTTGKMFVLQMADADGNSLKISNTSEPFSFQIPADNPASSFETTIPVVGFSHYKVSAVVINNLFKVI